MITQASHERTLVSSREGFKHAFVVHKLSRFKCVQSGADNEHANCSSRECFRLALTVSAQVFSSQMYFQARACTKGTNLLISRVEQACACCKCTAVSSQEFKECACGLYTSLPVSRCCGLAVVVIPSFRISNGTSSMHLGKHTRHLVARMFLACASRQESVRERFTPV